MPDDRILIGSLRTEKGCRRCDFCQNMENGTNSILLRNGIRGTLNNHLNSDRFRILRGAMNLLQEPYEMIVHTVTVEKKNDRAVIQ